MDRFRPELVMISSGFDAHEDDPLGGLKLKTEDFATLTEAVKKVADKFASGRIISVLEGGYNLKAIAASAKAHVDAL
jgi:acetoin utilization deacetylase AcuC-like enzyme